MTHKTIHPWSHKAWHDIHRHNGKSWWIMIEYEGFWWVMMEWDGLRVIGFVSVSHGSCWVLRSNKHNHTCCHCQGPAFSVWTGVFRDWTVFNVRTLLFNARTLLLNVRTLPFNVRALRSSNARNSTHTHSSTKCILHLLRCAKFNLCPQAEKKLLFLVRHWEKDMRIFSWFWKVLATTPIMALRCSDPRVLKTQVKDFPRRLNKPITISIHQVDLFWIHCSTFHLIPSLFYNLVKTIPMVTWIHASGAASWFPKMGLCTGISCQSKGAFFQSNPKALFPVLCLIEKLNETCCLRNKKLATSYFVDLWLAWPPFNT